MCIKSCHRQTVFTILSSMNEDETDIFNKLRSQIQDDVALFYLIADVSAQYDLKPESSTKSLVTLWKAIEDDNKEHKHPLTIKINKDSSITLGNGHTFNLNDIVKFSTDIDIIDVINRLLKLDREDSIRFNHIRLVFDDDFVLFKWIADGEKMGVGNVVEALLELKSNELEDLDVFNLAELETNSKDKCGILVINNIKLSIFFLAQMEPKLLNETILMARYVEEDEDILKGFHERIGHYRITSEFDRKKALEWFKRFTIKHTRSTGRYGQFRPHDLSHLHRIKSILYRYGYDVQQAIIDFVFTLNPKNINEFLNCCHFLFTWTCNTMERFTVELYRNDKKANGMSIRAWRGKKIYRRKTLSFIIYCPFSQNEKFSMNSYPIVNPYD